MNNLYESFAYDVQACRYFAEEPVYDKNGNPRAPARWYVWACRNLPTCIVLFVYARLWAGSMVCRVRGHRWQGDSWAGPESGGENWQCERCGCTHSVTYY